jgi:hypothetical protein
MQTNKKLGIALAETIMGALYGRAGVRINGVIVQSNSQMTKLYVGGDFVPTEYLHANLTEHEIHELENLPTWNGNNEYQISSIALCHVGAAAKRFNLKKRILSINTDSHAGDCQYQYMREKQNEIEICLCKKCSRARAAKHEEEIAPLS